MRRARASAALRAALLAAWALGCPQGPPPPPPPPPPAAVVDGVPIPLPLVQREVDRLRRASAQEPQQPGAPRLLPAAAPAPAAGPSDPQALARAVLGPLVDQKLLAARGRALGIQVGEADVQRETDALAENARAAGEPLEGRLQRDGLTLEQLHDETRERLLAERTMARELREAGVDRPTPQELKAFAEAHRAELEVPEQVHALHLLTSSPEKAKGLLDQLRKGAPFDELARANGESPDARAGGDLGFFARGTMPAVFDETCFSLKQGQLSGVVRSPYGYHLFKLLARRAGHRRTLEEARPELERRLVAEKRLAAERTLLEGLRQKAAITIDAAALAGIR